jgi:hypothetical protein
LALFGAGGTTSPQPAIGYLQRQELRMKQRELVAGLASALASSLMALAQ